MCVRAFLITVFPLRPYYDSGMMIPKRTSHSTEPRRGAQQLSRRQAGTHYSGTSLCRFQLAVGVGTAAGGRKCIWRSRARHTGHAAKCIRRNELEIYRSPSLSAMSSVVVHAQKGPAFSASCLAAAPAFHAFDVHAPAGAAVVAGVSAGGLTSVRVAGVASGCVRSFGLPADASGGGGASDGGGGSEGGVVHMCTYVPAWRSVFVAAGRRFFVAPVHASALAPAAGGDVCTIALPVGLATAFQKHLSEYADSLDAATVSALASVNARARAACVRGTAISHAPRRASRARAVAVWRARQPGGRERLARMRRANGCGAQRRVVPRGHAAARGRAHGSVRRAARRHRERRAHAPQVPPGQQQARVGGRRARCRAVDVVRERGSG